MKEVYDDENCMQISDGISVKIIRDKLNSFLEEQDEEVFTCLFIPVIIFTDVDDIVKAQFIEEIISENWENINGKFR